MSLENLLTIGQLGTLSNIHTKALRYYEQIGILTPHQINPDTGYRYYSYAHIPYVKMIKLCAQYDIPLAYFKDFVAADGSIDLDNILSLAQAKIQQKIADSQADLQQILSLQERLRQAAKIDLNGEIRYQENAQTFWSIPFSGQIFDKTYYKLLSKALVDLQAVNCQTQHKIGVYYDLSGDKGGHQLIIQITDHHHISDTGAILCLPAGSYISHHLRVGDIPSILENISSPYCMVFETYERHYELAQPHIELSFPNTCS